MNKKEERNYAIDFFRILFILVICWHHFQFETNVWIKNGWVCVEFFFILSGFYLYKNFIKKEQTTLEYIKSRVKKLYPHYLFSFIVIFFLCMARSLFKQELNIMEFLFKGLSELLFMQSNGIFSNGINYPIWYISVLMISSMIIYELLKQNKNLFLYVIIPIASIFFFNFIGNYPTGLETWAAPYGIYIPFFRGFIEMGIGCLISDIYSKYNVQINNLLKNKILYLFEILCYILLAYIIYSGTRYINYVLILFSLIIVLCNSSNSLTSKLFNRSIFKNSADLTYAMYLNHATIITFLFMVVPRIPFGITINSLLFMYLYLMLVVIYSVFTNNFIHRGK